MIQLFKHLLLIDLAENKIIATLGDRIKPINDRIRSSSRLLLGRSSRPELLVHRPAQFLIGDVEVSLRRLQVGMTEEQLNRAQVKAPGEPAAGGFVPQVVPVEVDVGELLAVHAAVCPRVRRLAVTPLAGGGSITTR